jgi:hypothetical protein
MNEMDSNVILLFQMLGEVLGAINRAVLTACTTESDLKMRETAFEETLRVVIHKRVNGLEEGENLTIFLKKVNNRPVEARESLEFIVFAGIMGRSAVKDITSSVSGFVNRNTAFERERVNCYG